jgi:arginase
LSERSYEIIGAPFDLGAPSRGSAAAPGYLREKGLTKRIESLNRFGVDVVDGGDVDGPTEGDASTVPPNLRELLSFGGSLIERLGRSYAAGLTPVVIGGDHSISVASVTAAARHLRTTVEPDAELGLVWVDAHPDLETPGAQPDCDLHGTPVAHLLGLGDPDLAGLGGFAPKLRPENVVQICLRDIMSCEAEVIAEHEITAYTATDVERLGIGEICSRTFAHMDERTDGFVLSFDIDACDVAEAPGVVFRERGGLTYREAMVVMEEASRAPKLVSLELVEVDPSRDEGGRTADLAIWLIHRALAGPPLERARGRGGASGRAP